MSVLAEPQRAAWWASTGRMVGIPGALGSVRPEVGEDTVFPRAVSVAYVWGNRRPEQAWVTQGAG